jgi:hypothetical protein
MAFLKALEESQMNYADILIEQSKKMLHLGVVTDDLDSRKFSVLGLASIQQFNLGKVQPTAPCNPPERVPPFTAPRKS